MKNHTIAKYAVVSAIYVALTLALSSLSYGGIQFRVAEALMLLCFYKKDYWLPLTIGCFIANLFSPMALFDILFGTTATLLSALLMPKCKNVFIASLMPVIFNAVIVSAELWLAFKMPVWLSFLQVGAGELLCVSVLGVILFKNLEKNEKFMALIKK